MNAIVRPNQPIIFMKVGVHAREPLEKIIERKLQEIEDEGMALWGYGGNTCHPLSMVQPFAAEQTRLGLPIYLCMEKMVSNHFAEPKRADEFSIDGNTWRPVPDGIHVLGSRYALAIKSLREESFELPVSQSHVAVGPSQGRRGSEYISGRVDKACLALEVGADVPPAPQDRVIQIGLVAELCDPYAVFLRNV